MSPRRFLIHVVVEVGCCRTFLIVISVWEDELRRRLSLLMELALEPPAGYMS